MTSFLQKHHPKAIQLKDAPKVQNKLTEENPR